MARQMPAPQMDIAASAPRSTPWWLRVSSYGWDTPAKSLAERELIRRSQLASWVILTLLIVAALLLPVGVSDFTTLVAVLVGMAGFLFAAFLNRRGHVYFVGGFLIVLLCTAIIGAIATQPGGLFLDLLPSFDFLLMPTLVAASILPRRSAFVVAALNSLLICGTFFLEPPAADLTRDLATYPSVIEGTITLLIRPIALQVLVATIAFLWVRGTERAIVRADQAEHVAALQAAIAEERLQLEVGVTEIERALNNVANGRFATRITPLPQEQLWRIGSAINNILSRLHKAADTEQAYRQLVTEIQRLAAAIDAGQHGRPPLWPAPSGTPLDMIIQQIHEDVRRPRPPQSLPPTY